MPARLPYDLRTFIPPAPAVTLTFHFGGRQMSELALLDTGSDITTVTSRVVSTLGVTPIGEIAVSGATGAIEPRRLYRTDLDFSGKRYRNHGLALLNTSYVLVGRDILNDWITTLDGPRLTFWLKSGSRR